jgi:putative FmdB family regulatory protein
MPTYEYECDQCGDRFEEFQGIKEEPIRECPSCGGPLRRLIGPGAAVILRGGESRSSRRRPGCDRATPCCGRDIPCGRPPCDDEA